MISALAIILLSVGFAGCALMYAMTSRQVRRQSDEITELQATVDLLLVDSGHPAVFAPRYGLELVDPTEEGG